jgi:uncharacterized protein (PEP-CTERM system associated)
MIDLNQDLPQTTPTVLRFSCRIEMWMRQCALPLGVLFLLPVQTHAQAQNSRAWNSEAALQVNTTATTNAALAPSGAARKDLVTSIQPSYQLSGQGAHFKLKARVGADVVNSARGTPNNANTNNQNTRISPLVQTELNAMLVEKLVLIDSSINIASSELNAYAPRIEMGTAQNRQRVSTYRLSPYVNYKVSEKTLLLARHEEVISDTAASMNTEAIRQRFSNTQLRAERKPTPWGGSLEFSKQQTRLSAQGTARWSLTSYKAVGDWAMTDELVAGPVWGQERSTLLLQDQVDNLYGLHLQWKPSERTLFSAEVAHRFFGTGWDVNLRHRTALTSFVLEWNRVPVTTVNALGATTSTQLSGFLDAILTGQYPNAVERAALVNDLIDSRGLRADLPNAVNVTVRYAQLQTGVNATWVLLGARNTLALSAYRQTRQRLARSGDLLSNSLSVNAQDNRQTGASLNLSRRLTPQLSAALTSSWSRIRGLALRAADVSDEQIYRLTMTQLQSPRTGISTGLQYNRFRTTVVGINSYSATAAFVGLSHRF